MELQVILNELNKINEKIDDIAREVTIASTNIYNIKEDVAKNTSDLEVHIAGTITNVQRLELEIETREKLENRVNALDAYIMAAKIRKAKVREIYGIIVKIISIIGVAGTVTTLVLRLLKVI